ncbi:alpha/beta hydrolase [Adhaeretor mobilis]|uniref:Acetylxylan esterase n=1 Tax=Adhaeretor mobilis TaxID=1930276 RepID=A0A517MPL4_9BACT|nr:alpha/beta hydrolase [Adhaeretor mobilis]QDS96819.1 Acetylxylan esterase precursor [Adhaeretor mobilis]
MFRFIFCFLAICQTVALAEDPSVFVPIWPEDHAANHQEVDDNEGTPEWRERIETRPEMMAYLPAEGIGNGTAVLVLPGGAYGNLALEHEGSFVGEWFQERGVAAFVLKYRCGGGPNQQPVPLQDAQRALRLIAAGAEETGVNPQKIGVIGFSAGGHLASCVATMGDDGNPEAMDPVDRLPAHAAFAVLVYPVISMDDGLAHRGSRRNLLGENPNDALMERYTTWKQVDKQTPPTLLFHSSDDKSVVPANSIRFYEALLANKVPTAMHIFAHGGHGYGMHPGKRSFRKWPELMEGWLTERTLLKKRE